MGWGEFAISLLPYLAPVVGAILVYLAKVLVSSVAANANAGAALKATAAFAQKAAMVVASLEQTERAAFAKACADGKLTADEAKELGALAVSALLDMASGDMDVMGVVDVEARKRIATAAVETEVYKLKRSNRIDQVTAATRQ